MIDWNYEKVVFFRTRKRHRGEHCRDRGKTEQKLGP